MDPNLIYRGLAAGLIATGAITLTEFPIWHRWGIDGVPEWEMNQAMISRLLHRPRELLVVEGQALHFLQGGLLGIVFAVAVPCLPQNLSLVMAGIMFGLVLWVVSLVILKPITGVGVMHRPLGALPPLGSLVGHLIYGLVLGLLMV